MGGGGGGGGAALLGFVCTALVCHLLMGPFVQHRDLDS